MSPASLRRVSLAVVLLALALIAAATAFSLKGGNRVDVAGDSFIWAITFVFAVAGHVIATRQPGNAIGWLFHTVAVSAALGRLAGAYAAYWLSSGAGPEVLGRSAAWYGTISWVPFILVPAIFLLLLFPDGHLLSKRWRPVAWCAIVGIVGVWVATGLAPGPLEDYPELANPYGVDSPLRALLAGLAVIACLVGLAGSAASLLVRFRRARGVERQQMKWIGLAGSLTVTALPLMVVAWTLAGPSAANALMMLSILTIPMATAVAVVRYRLYDIDVVINRTLVYGSLTATLAGVYVGTVLLLQLALSGLTEESSLAVATSTLAVAALFRPIRSRIQHTVDRRFFRSSYDAAQTVNAFGARLRDEVDLTALSADLQAVVAVTMRPAHVSLWLRTQDSA